MSRTAAIFDLDRTLITRSSGTLFVKYMQQTGQIWDHWRRRDVTLTLGAMIRYQIGLMDAVTAMRRLARLADGMKAEVMWGLVEAWFDDFLVHCITRQARDQLDWHRTRGHIPVICSASNQFAVIPVARHLGIEHFGYSEWLVEEGVLTGYIGEPILYGRAKLEWMRQWSAEHDVDLSRCYFYSDDASDLPLLEIVEHPIAVNPHRSLHKIARQRRWPILRWR